MEQLDLLCLLEDHYNLLSDLKKQKKELADIYLVDQKTNTIIRLEKEINILKKGNEDTKETLKKSEKLLKDYHYTIEEIEDKLYSGNTSDIKQLQILSNEKNEIKETISNTETKILECMEEISQTEEKLNNIKVDLEKLIKNKQEKKLEYLELDRGLNKSIENEIEKIKNLELDIEEKNLSKYKIIRKNNKTAIGKMENGICTGCNMAISKFIAEKIKDSMDIISCENCGRILCKQKPLNC